MWRTLKRSWSEFQHGQPGQRFQRRYEHNRSKRRTRPWYSRFVKTVLGLVLIGIGILLTFLPGPALLFLPVGAGLLADEFLVVARLLDWIEVKARRMLAAAKSWWQHTSALRRGALMVLGLAACAGAGYLLYRITALSIG